MGIKAKQNNLDFSEGVLWTVQQKNLHNVFLLTNTFLSMNKEYILLPTAYRLLPIEFKLPRFPEIYPNIFDRNCRLLYMPSQVFVRWEEIQPENA